VSGKTVVWRRHTSLRTVQACSPICNRRGEWRAGGRSACALGSQHGRTLLSTSPRCGPIRWPSSTIDAPEEGLQTVVEPGVRHPWPDGEGLALSRRVV
jgi:hypothetical protein